MLRRGLEYRRVRRRGLPIRLKFLTFKQRAKPIPEQGLVIEQHRVGCSAIFSSANVLRLIRGHRLGDGLIRIVRFQIFSPSIRAVIR